MTAASYLFVPFQFPGKQISFRVHKLNRFKLLSNFEPEQSEQIEIPAAIKSQIKWAAPNWKV